MADLKWADVAHMYQFSGIQITHKGNPKDKFDFEGVARLERNGKKALHAVFVYGNGSMGYSSMPIAEYVAILRHVDDITNEQAALVYSMAMDEDYNNAVFPWKSAKGWVKAYIGPNIGRSIDCNTLVMHQLLLWGFDIYRLIEMGEAIRKPQD